MIEINGIPLDSTTLQNEYPDGGEESAILSLMQKSNETYRYKTEDELTFELTLRAGIVRAAKELYQSGLAFSTFHEAKCNPDYWERTKNGGFLLREDVSPADAIQDIFQNGEKYATECATAMMIVYYGALLHAFGKEDFDRVFPRIYLMDWSIRQPLLQDVGNPRKLADILPGDRAYFINEDVDPSVPWWRGENVIVLTDGYYYGHGVGILNKEQIISNLNANRKKDSDIPARLLDRASRPDFQKLYGALHGTLQEEARPEPIMWRLPSSIRNFLSDMQ